MLKKEKNGNKIFAFYFGKDGLVLTNNVKAIQAPREPKQSSNHSFIPSQLITGNVLSTRHGMNLKTS